MTLGRKLQILAAAEYTADRSAGLFRRHGHLTAENGRKRLLAAEAAAGDVLMDVNIRRPAAQRAHDRAVDIVGALHGAVDVHASALLRLGHHPLRFEIGLILIAGLKFLVVDLIRLGKGLFHVALFVFIVEKRLVRLPQIEHRLQRLVFHLGAADNILAHSLVRAAYHADRLADILDRFAGIDRRVVHDDVDVVVAGHIVLVDVAIALRQLRQPHRQQLCPRVCGAQHLSAQHAVAVDVPHKNAAAGHFRLVILFNDRPRDIFHALPSFCDRFLL